MNLDVGWGALASLFGVVAFGSVIPVVPTGAAVSAAAVVGAHEGVAGLLAVVAAGAVAAYLGDLITYAVCRWGGEGAVRRLPWLRRGNGRSARTAERLAARPVTVLLVSRLVPGGRIPVLLAAGVFGVPWRHFGLANAAACLLWSAVYSGIGLTGHAIFPEPWQAIVAVVAVVLLVSFLSERLAGWAARRGTAGAGAAGGGAGESAAG